MEVREAGESDRAAWSRMRRALWPDCDEASCEAEMTRIDGASDQLALLAFDDAGAAIGFAEFSVHPHATGCRTTDVGYLEGWYVEASARRRGVGAMLLGAGEAWARGIGCREMASDTWMDNTVSHDAHLALGFEETERLIHYRKALVRDISAASTD